MLRVARSLCGSGACQVLGRVSEQTERQTDRQRDRQSDCHTTLNVLTVSTAVAGGGNLISPNIQLKVKVTHCNDDVAM